MNHIDTEKLLRVRTKQKLLAGGVFGFEIVDLEGHLDSALLGKAGGGRKKFC
jgi:hypothetical protein